MINIIQSPEPFYPAYNDSYIKYTTTYASDDRSVITITGTPYQFTVYPNPNGEYLFNLKHIIAALINPNKFNDELDYTVSGWGFIDNSLFKQLDLDITVYGDGTSEVLSQSYTFNKAVKQFGDKVFSNDYQLMLPSKDGINYHLTYWEGYPIELPFRYVQQSVDTGGGVFNNEITLKNKRTEDITTPFRPTATAPYRLFIDKASTNFNTSDVLPLPDMMNKIDIMVDGVVKTSVDITKKSNECGTYLKWFNADGSYSYWLFNQWYKQEYEGVEYDRVGTNNFTNIFDNTQGNTSITGKEGSSSIKLKTVVTEDEKNHLVSLITSPLVQMYSSQEPNIDGTWLDVKVLTKGLTYNSKKFRNQVSIEIELPSVNTQTI